jgi:RNA polymerase-interacting CarD/CdnL/TRCF family regulator
MKQLIADEIVKTIEPKIFDKDVTLSQLTSKYIEVSHDGQTAMMPMDKLDTKKMRDIGISEKVIGDIRKSFEKSENELRHPENQPLSKLKENARNMFEKAKENGGKIMENIKNKGQER